MQQKLSKKELLDSLYQTQIFSSKACTGSISDGKKDEFKHYLNFSGNRITNTFSELLKYIDASKTNNILEIGAGPYFLTSLILKYLKCDFSSIGRPPGVWPGNEITKHETTYYAKIGNEVYPFNERICNVEKDYFPFEENKFDIVIATEILEHLIFSPTHFLYEIHRVLKPGGILVLTTPNASSITKMIKIILGKSVWDYYSGYGVYGRHQREYTQKELTSFLSALNYKVLKSKGFFYSSVQLTLSDMAKRTLFLLAPFRRPVLFIVAEAFGKEKAVYPDYLYKSIYKEYWKKWRIKILG